MATGESSGTLVSTAESDRLLLAMEGIQQQIRSMKNELSDDRDTANEWHVKCIKLPGIKGRLSREKVMKSRFSSQRASAREGFSDYYGGLHCSYTSYSRESQGSTERR